MADWIETLNPDGSLRTRWDLAAGVCLITPVDIPAPVWERTEVNAPWVDGNFVVHSSIGKMEVVTRLTQQRPDVPANVSPWPACSALTQAIIEDVSLTNNLFLRVVLGDVTMTYRASRPDIDAPIGIAVETGIREVTLTWPVLPHPAVTGTVV